MKTELLFKRCTIASIWIGLGGFALLPLLLVLGMSFLKNSPSHLYQWHLTWQHYLALLDPIYIKLAWRSFLLALQVTFFCLLISYPFAFILANSPKKNRALLLLLVIIPFWTSSLLRSYAIIMLIQTNGLLNHVLLNLGIIQHPLHMLYTNAAVIIGLVYNLLPFMILPLYSNMEQLNPELIEAAKDLGANKTQILFRVLLPLTFPGILSGCLLVLLPAMTLFFIPDILGGAKSLLLGNLIQMQFFQSSNWPLGAAISVMLTIFMGILLWFYSRQVNMERQLA